MLIWCSVGAFVVGGGLILAAVYHTLQDLVSYHMGWIRISVNHLSISQEAVERYRRNREQQAQWMEDDLDAKGLEGPFKSVVSELRADANRDDYSIRQAIRESDLSAFAKIFRVDEVTLSRPRGRRKILLASGLLLLAGSMVESLLR